MTIIKMIEIREASKSQAAEIASLIMTAMTDDCCLYFCGEGYGLEDFLMVDVCMNCATPLSRLPRSISAKIILVWMTRRRQANCILTRWLCFQIIVVRALPESCCWRPKNEPIVWACRVLDFWLIKTILSARHYTPLSASNT